MNDYVRRTGRRTDPGALLTGLVLIGAGVAFLTGQFGEIMRDWWPMIIVLVGVSQMFRRRSIWHGLWLIAVGCWLQAIRLHLFGLTFRNAWPLLLIVIGAGIALRAVFDVVPNGEGRDA